MRYRVLGGHSGLVVSEVALGAGNFGNQWGYGAEPDEARRMFEGYVEAGGNFIDTGDVYQYGQSERLIRDFIGSRRNDFVLASKYTGGSVPNGGFGITGNCRRTMLRAVEESLARLGTDRLDVYWVHYPDGMTPVEEIVRGMEDLTRAGKVVYAGLSDFPAWRVARAATIAEVRGWVPVAAVQIEYSLVERTSDRELLPMAAALDLGVVAWGVLGGGLLSGKYRRGEQGRAHTFKLFVHQERTAHKSAVLDAVQGIARELGATESQVAIAWVLAKGLIPVLGPRSRTQLDEILGALSVSLSETQVDALDRVSAIPLGFPHEMLAAEVDRKRADDPKLARLARPERPVS